MPQSYISMKSEGQQRKSTASLSAKCKAGKQLSCSKSGTSIAKPAKQRCRRKGKFKTELSGRLPPPIQPLSLQAQIIGTSLQKASPGIPKPVPEQSTEHLRKFKLQLFPIDEATREILEKDKHNPYLELTLGTKKKISSVVKHLSTKWASSKAASGELILFPFDARLENLAGHRRWTSSDSVTSAADVYVAVGNPAVFRLRYGWLSSLEPKICAMPLMSLHSEDDLQAEDHKMNTGGERNHPCAESSQEHGPMFIDGSLDQVAGTPNMLDTSVQAVNKDNLRKWNGTSLSWLDRVSNISFGALLSEVSPTSHGHPLPVQNYTSFQQSSNLDSFDAAIAGLIARQQATSISAQVPHSSIWEAEETCHAFPFQKISSGKSTPSSVHAAPFIPCSRTAGSNLLRLHDTTELGSQVVRAQDDARQEPASSQQLQVKGGICLKLTADLHPDTKGAPSEEPKVELQRQSESSRNDDNRVGLMDAYWPESLGHLEYVASSSRQVIGGDCISGSGLIASSLDAFQNCSIF